MALARSRSIARPEVNREHHLKKTNEPRQVAHHNNNDIILTFELLLNIPDCFVPRAHSVT